MPYATQTPSARVADAQAMEKIAQEIHQLALAALPAGSPNLSLYQEMLNTVVRMAQADRNRWDAKILLQTMREMERSFDRLSQLRHRRKVTVFGSARTPEDHGLYKQARDLGSALAKNNWMVITGAGGGIMAAAHEGAGRENSLGLNITLPFEQSANATVEGSENLLSFHFFFVRKLFFIKEADAIVLSPGGFGTLDEALEALTLIQTGKSPLVPIILLDEPGGTYWNDMLDYIKKQLVGHRYIAESDLRLMRLTDNVDVAVDEIEQFYRNYNSSRWHNGQFIIRLNHALSTDAVTQIQQKFRDICPADDFVQHLQCSQSVDHGELAELPRLIFTFNGRDHGRLRELYNFINNPAHFS